MTDIKEIVQQSIDWSFTNGLTMIKKPTEQEIKDGVVTASHLPYTLFPSKMPRQLYNQSLVLAKDFNLLVHHLSRNFNFIQNTLKDVSDEFTRRLLNIHQIVEKEGVKQTISLGIFRSDYMIHDPEGGAEKPSIFQVELNTISSSFGSLSTKVFDLHKYLIGYNSIEGYDLADHPENSSLTNIVNAIATAHKLYLEQSKSKDQKVVMMLVQDGERNLYDQKWIEITLWNLHKVRLIRRTLTEVNQRAVLRAEDEVLIIDGFEVSIAYYRAGYTPNDYHSDKEWDARLLIERSSAVKCPTIAHHLVGAKKIQQAIAKPGLLESYISDSESLKRMREVFTGLYSLSKDDIDKEAVKSAIANPRHFVMKPQREGGGNNIYNENVAIELQRMSPEQLSDYILMDKIFARPFKTHIVRDRQHMEIEALYELGVYGLFISQSDQIHLNEEGGVLLRTKTSSSDEGGVAAGFGVIDSPILY